MKKAAFTLLVTIAASLFIISCGERENPVIEEPLYEIVAQVPPVGVFKQMDFNGANTVIAADYAGIATIDLSNPSSPGVVNVFGNDHFGIEYFDDISACYYNNDTKRIWYARADASGSIVGAIWAPPDTFLTVQVFRGTNPRSFYCQDAYHFEGDSAVTDSMLVALIDWGEIFNFESSVFTLNSFGFGQIQRITSYINLDAHPYDSAISDDWHYAYLAVDKVGLQIIDISIYEQLAPSIGSFDTEGYSRGIDLQDDIVYLADWHWGLQIIDVSDPTNPVRISNLKFPGADDCEKVKVVGDKAAVMDRYNGIYGVDISDPSNPVEMFNFDTITPTDIEVTEDYIFVVDEDAGLYIVSW